MPSQISTRSRRRTLLSSAILVAAASTCVLGAQWEPAENKVILGAWVDAQAGFSDRPALINQRLEPLPPLALHALAQTIPIPPFNIETGAGGPANITHVVAAGTSDTHVFLTVYPDDGLSSVTDADLTILGQQLADWEQQYGFKTFLRFAPEMNGGWMRWGLQPTLFLSTWRRMYTEVKRLSPNTAIVWSPNVGYGYPSGGAATTTADARLLDTDNDGRLTANDDPYAPFYPGDAYTDWNGVSLYFKGPGFQNLNQPQPGGYCNSLLHGADPYYPISTTLFDFYQTYCSAKPSKACAISESGAVFHLSLPTAPAPLTDHVGLQRAWWQDCITNSTFLDLHPRLKMINMFEFEKVEYDGGVRDERDFRITNDTGSLAGFKADLTTVQDRFVWATPASSSSTDRPNSAASPSTAGNRVTVNGGTLGASYNLRESMHGAALASVLLVTTALAIAMA